MNSGLILIKTKPKPIIERIGRNGKILKETELMADKIVYATCASAPEKVSKSSQNHH